MGPSLSAGVATGVRVEPGSLQLGGRGAQLTWPVAISRIEAEAGAGDTEPVYTQPHVDLETYQVSGV